MKKIYIIAIGLCASLGTISNIFAAAAAEDVAEQEAAWVEKQRVQQEAIDQADLTFEQKALGEQLIEAAGDGNMERVKELLELGAPVNFKSKMGYTPLMLAALSEEDTWPVIILLLGVGARVNDRSEEKGDTALLMVACNNRDLSYFITLIDAGADVNISDNDGIAPLRCAVERGNRDAINFLLGAGALIDQQDIYGETALMTALNLGYVNVMRVLILAGANLNIVNNSGETVRTQLNTYWSGKMRTRINNTIEKAIKEREYAQEMEKELEEELLLPSDIRGMVLDYEQDPTSSAQRRLKERQKARAQQGAREPAIAAERVRRENEEDEKEEDEKEEYAAAPVSAQAQAGRRVSGERRVSSAEQAAGVREGESFYESALRAAEETQALRQQEGFQPGQVPLPNPETGFYDED